jgi:hypothetical protein
MDIVVVAGCTVETGIVAGCTVGMDIVAAADCMVGTDIVIEMDTVDRVMTAVDIVAEDWCTDQTRLERTKVGCIGLYLLMYCHSHHRTEHSLRFVCHNFRSILPHFVQVQEHVYHGHTEYRMWFVLEFVLGMRDKYSLQEGLPEILVRHHNVYKRPRLLLHLHDSVGRLPDADRLPPGCHRCVQRFRNQDKIFSR